MRKLSVGCDSSLGEYLKLTRMTFGPDSRATKFLEMKIEESAEGENEEVIVEESQMLHLLAMIHLGKAAV